MDATEIRVVNLDTGEELTLPRDTPPRSLPPGFRPLAEVSRAELWGRLKAIMEFALQDCCR